jgi:uncharacterized protein
MTVRRIGPDAYLRVPWKNGGGVSVTMAGEMLPGSASGDWSGVVWQLGRTDIVTPAPFSDLSGFERLQTVVRGEGLFLDTPSGVIDLSEPLSVARYDGGTPIVSRLARGPVGVVNLIARRSHATIAMVVLRAQGQMQLAGGQHVVYAPIGMADLGLDATAAELAPDHALIIDGPGHLTCRSGLVLVCTIQRIPVS